MAIKGDDAFRAMRPRLADLLPRLNERDRRLAMATEAKSWGRGGISAVQQVTGASQTTIRRGMAELAEGQPQRSDGRIRATGSGRKNTEIANPELLEQPLHPIRRRRPGILSQRPPVFTFQPTR